MQLARPLRRSTRPPCSKAAPPVNQGWAYGATAPGDAAAAGTAGLYQTGLEMVQQRQRPVDVTYSNGSAWEREQRR